MRCSILLFLFSLCNLLYAQDQIGKTGKNRVLLEDNGEAIIAKVAGQPVLQYNYKTQYPPEGKEAYYQRSGFIHPIYTPAGDTLTEGFPKGHTHQHGVFNAWVNTEFKEKEIDFWNQHDETGTVIFKEIIAKKETTEYARFKTKQQHLAFIAGDTIAVLEELWTITIYDSADPYIWDIEVEQTNIANAVLDLKKYHYGGMAFRGRDAWDYSLEGHKDENKLNFRTTSAQSRREINHSRPDWITMTGVVNEKELNLSVIPGSTNFRAPEAVRVHPDMPYFCFTPFVEEGFNLKPGKNLKNTYRIITTDKTPAIEELNAIKAAFHQKN